MNQEIIRENGLLISLNLILTMNNDYLNAWKANNYINDALLDYFVSLPVKSKVQRIFLFDEFVQILNVRKIWLEENRVLSHTELDDLQLQPYQTDRLKSAFSKSSEAIGVLIDRCVQEGKIGGFKSALDFINYMVSVESQSRNKIVLLFAYPN